MVDTDPKVSYNKNMDSNVDNTQTHIKEATMATTKTYTVTGSTTLNGKTKIRFCNDVMRIKVLDKNGHENINLIDLPEPMTKGQIAQYLMDRDFAKGDSDVLAAIKYIAKKNSVTLKNKEQVTGAVAEATVTAI